MFSIISFLAQIFHGDLTKNRIISVSDTYVNHIHKAEFVHILYINSGLGFMQLNYF